MGNRSNAGVSPYGEREGGRGALDWGLPRWAPRAPPLPAQPSLCHGQTRWDSRRTTGAQDCLTSFLQRAGRKRKGAEVRSSP